MGPLCVGRRPVVTKDAGVSLQLPGLVGRDLLCPEFVVGDSKDVISLNLLDPPGISLVAPLDGHCKPRKKVWGGGGGGGQELIQNSSLPVAVLVATHIYPDFHCIILHL